MDPSTPQVHPSTLICSVRGCRTLRRVACRRPLPPAARVPSGGAHKSIVVSCFVVALVNRVAAQHWPAWLYTVLNWADSRPPLLVRCKYSETGKGCANRRALCPQSRFLAYWALRPLLSLVPLLLRCVIRPRMRNILNFSGPVAQGVRA